VLSRRLSLSNLNMLSLFPHRACTPEFTGVFRHAGVSGFVQQIF